MSSRGRGRGRPPMSMVSISKIEFLSNESKVEVSSDDEGFKGAWYSAKIVTPPKRKNQVLVQYDHLLSETDPSKPLIEGVPSSFIRPVPPPPLPDQTYEPHDVVDAFHRDGWWKGVVTDVQVSEENKTSYNVVFETPPELFTFSSQHLRFHLDWTHAQWVQTPKQMEVPNIAQSAHVDNIAKHSEEKSYVKKSRKKSTPLKTNSTSNKLKKKPPEREETLARYSKKLRKENSPSRLSHPISMLLNSAEQDTGSVCKSDGNLPVAGSNQQEAGQGNGKAESSKRERVLNAQVMSQQVPAAVVEDKKNTDPADSNSFTRLTPFLGPCAENSFHLPHEEINIQKESNAFGQQDKGEEHNVFEGIASKMDIQDCGDLIADHTTKVGGASVNDDLALSTCIRMEKQELPFTKTLSLWQYVDSLEVFKVLPQKPHFIPLLEENEATREGFAIGNMLNFAGLVEKASKLKMNNPRNVFDSYLKALSDLEMHGFDVKMVVDQISKLLSIKIREEKLKNESHDLDCKIMQCDSQKAKLEGEIKELEEQLAVKVEQKARIDSERNLLRNDAITLKEETVNAKLDFVREARVPWLCNL
ncbi:DUF724 domain-containing protein 7-like isoform X5 [Euphorbia lathyris]|uniref:DUF724 domain-containing protein 7-like isoform X5 n=1 Tax=Euphorbia lathyris TaxID=212925 RepID=UPI0033142895